MRKKKAEFVYTPDQLEAVKKFHIKLDELYDLAMASGLQTLEVKIVTGMGAKLSWEYDLSPRAGS